jgi:solute carrier family 35 protein E3
VLLLACIAPFVDTPPNVSVIPRDILWTLVGSGVLASLLNLSQFLIIGRTSALTFNIVSNLKTVMIVGLSWWLEGKIPGVRDLVGVGMALGGAWAYSRVSTTR